MQADLCSLYCVLSILWLFAELITSTPLQCFSQPIHSSLHRDLEMKHHDLWGSWLLDCGIIVSLMKFAKYLDAFLMLHFNYPIH